MEVNQIEKIAERIGRKYRLPVTIALIVSQGEAARVHVGAAGEELAYVSAPTAEEALTAAERDAVNT